MSWRGKLTIRAKSFAVAKPISLGMISPKVMMIRVDAITCIVTVREVLNPYSLAIFRAMRAVRDEKPMFTNVLPKRTVIRSRRGCLNNLRILFALACLLFSSFFR
ncbi:MAG: hypothetical protein BWX83_01170 [Candidatus Cloacimonetes bacterium ADurb.Bin117]|nr:MAG: hypothetical protein BWX83_01170 [Candidatus Cloacimonetes bacterium ADurb.Bin117]